MTRASSPADEPSGLMLTGERTLPGIGHEGYWFARHVAAYRMVAAAAAGKVVLDAGCGEGYGLALLARAGARRVVGVDRDARVVDHVTATYARDDSGIEAVAAELGELPHDDGTFDLTVSLQVIEHLHDIPAYLASLRRVTRGGGEIVVATPNRLTFTPGSDVPVNPFHTREFTAEELRDELTGAGLAVERLVGVHHGRRLRVVEATTRRTVPTLVTERPPESWPAWLTVLVSSVRASWFEVSDDRLDTSLDLVARCRVA